jgi:hypothetical protein
MKTLIKRIAIQLYCRGHISATTTARVFARINLRRA